MHMVQIYALIITPRVNPVGNHYLHYRLVRMEMSKLQYIDGAKLASGDDTLLEE